MLCISTSFQVLRAPKSWLKYFYIHLWAFTHVGRCKVSVGLKLECSSQAAGSEPLIQEADTHISKLEGVAQEGG